MLRALALLALGGCFFDADYRRGHYTCSDGVCPTGLICVQGVCESERRDAATDTATFDDAPPRAATCSDPQPFPSTGGMTAGTTTGHPNNVAPMCNGSVQNGTDAVYQIKNTTGPVLVTVTGAFSVTAYAVSSCTPPSTTCVSNATAVPGNPLSLPAGSYFLVVDSAFAAMSGDYTLKLEVQ